jgi:hypothetical protein
VLDSLGFAVDVHAGDRVQPGAESASGSQLPPIDLWALFPSGHNVRTKARAFANSSSRGIGAAFETADGDVDSATD